MGRALWSLGQVSPDSACKGHVVQREGPVHSEGGWAGRRGARAYSPRLCLKDKDSLCPKRAHQRCCGLCVSGRVGEGESSPGDVYPVCNGWSRLSGHFPALCALGT